MPDPEGTSTGRAVELPTHLIRPSRTRAQYEPLVVVSIADKLQYARSILADLRELGSAMFERFTAGRDEQLWYYRSLVQAFRGHPSRMAGELRRIVTEIEIVASAG